MLVLWGDGIHDDTEALQTVLDGQPVVRMDSRVQGGTYRITRPVLMGNWSSIADATIIYKP